MMDYDAFATPFILIDSEPMYQIDMDKINQRLNLNQLPFAISLTYISNLTQKVAFYNNCVLKDLNNQKNCSQSFLTL